MNWLYPGSSAWLGRNNWEFTRDRAFKVTSVRWTVVSNGPIVCQVRAYGPDGSTGGSIAESGPFCVGVVPHKGSLRITAPWFGRDYDGSRPIVAWEVLCPNNNDTKRTAYWTLEVVMTLSPEEMQASCPKTVDAIRTEDFVALLQGGTATAAAMQPPSLTYPNLLHTFGCLGKQ